MNFQVLPHKSPRLVNLMAGVGTQYPLAEWEARALAEMLVKAADKLPKQKVGDVVVEPADLPVGTIVVSPHGEAMQKCANGFWMKAGVQHYGNIDASPALYESTILWLPEVSA